MSFGCWVLMVLGGCVESVEVDGCWDWWVVGGFLEERSVEGKERLWGFWVWCVCVGGRRGWEFCEVLDGCGEGLLSGNVLRLMPRLGIEEVLVS